MVKLLGRELWQWDIGRKIEIAQPDGNTVNEVHFAKRGDTEAPVVVIQDNIAEIPNCLLQDDRPLYVYLVMTDGETEQTLRVATFAVRSKPKPADYVYTETEVFRWETIEEKLKSLEEAEKYEMVLNSGNAGISAVYNALNATLLKMENRTSKNIRMFCGAFSSSYAFGMLYKDDEVDAIFDGYTDKGDDIRLVKKNREWSQVEKPKMVPSVEYKTAELWNGKPVYTMMLNVGAMPAAKTKYIYFDQTIAEVVGIEGVVSRTNPTNGKMFSYPMCGLSTVAEYWVQHDGVKNYFAVKTTADLSEQYTAKAVLKYIK